jgi:hypothetical protein
MPRDRRVPKRRRHDSADSKQNDKTKEVYTESEEYNDLNRRLSAKARVAIHKLYSDLDRLVEDGLKESRLHKKALLILVAERHQDHNYPGSYRIFRNVLLVQTILLDICKRHGIKRIYLERNKRFYTEVLKPACEKDPELGQGNLCTYIQNVKDHDLQFFYAEENVEEKYFENEASDAITYRDKKMIETLSKSQQHALYSVGFDHFKAIHESELLKSKFVIRGVSTLTSRFEKDFEIDFEKVGEKKEVATARMKVVRGITQSKAVFQTINAIEYNDSYGNSAILMLVKEAAEIFRLKQAALADKAAKGNKRAAVTEAKMVDAGKQAGMLAATMVKGLPQTAPFPIQLPPVDSNNASSHPSRFSLETVPIHQLLQVGFWGAARRGLCPKVTVPIWIEHATPQEEILVSKAKCEAAANQQLQNRGSSLESALRFFFKKTFSPKATEKQIKNKLLVKEFLIRILNGESSTVVREIFNQHLTITNKHFREKNLIKLAKADQQEANAYRLGLKS